jgi:small subunit ribosomal protein S16
MLVIRFARFGRKKSAFFKLVVAEKARAAQKKPVAELGWFNPHAEGGKGEFKFDAEAVKKYITNGAQVSQTAARKLVKEGIKEAGKFIEQRATKPKKEAPKVEEKPVDEVVASETAEGAAEEATEEVVTEEVATEEKAAE